MIIEVFDFLDNVGISVDRLIKNANFDDISPKVIGDFLNVDNKKLIENKNYILTGLYFLSSLNSKIISS